MQKKIFYSVLILLILLVYLPLLLFSTTGGDTAYYYHDMLKDFSLIPYAWSWRGNNGFGGFYSPFTSNHLLSVLITIFGNYLSFSWELVQKIVFVIPFISLSILGSYLLGKELFKTKLLATGSSVIYLINTYILMLLSGGQYVVASAYGLIPLVLYLFILFLNKLTIYSASVFALVYGLLVMFDLRIAYIAGIVLFLYFLFKFIFYNTREFYVLKKKLLLLFSFILVMVGLLQSFWLLPTAIHRENPIISLAQAFTSNEALSFFSFAVFEYALSFHHPNWPKNIFGQVDFLRAQFLIFPILAFSSLLFLRRVNKGYRGQIIFFTILALLGVFFAKGDNEPFGIIYQFLFNYFPGFIMFRDSTKWYSLIALSYAFLIPFSLKEIYEFIHQKFPTQNQIMRFGLLFTISLLAVWILLPAFSWKLPGTFQSKSIPQEYHRFTNEIAKEPFFRTLWIPQVSRFGYSSEMHPAISAYDFYKTREISRIVNVINNKEEIERLQEAGVKYIVIPYDSEGELFLTDRKFDQRIVDRLKKDISSNPFVKRNTSYKDLVIFEVPGSKNHLWSPHHSTQISARQINPTLLNVSVVNARKGDTIIFNESYSPGWILQTDNTLVTSFSFNDLYNGFTLPKDGAYTIQLSYNPQMYVWIGIVLSFLSLIILLFILTRVKIRLGR